MNLSDDIRKIFTFWRHLSLTWALMAIEGPILTAIIARLPDPKHNLAAFGVAFGISLVIEAPVIMILSATTALVRNSSSYRLVRNFIYALCVITTLVMIASAHDPFFSWITGTLMDLDQELKPLVRTGLLVMAVWPAAIGYRRFLQGLILRAERPDVVARCTIVRVISIVAGTYLLARFTSLPGVAVGCGGLSIAVFMEAVAAQYVIGSFLKPYRDETQQPGYRLTLRDLVTFYFPLSLTSFIGLSTNAIFSFFLSRAQLSLESLAVIPVVNSLCWFVQSFALALEEAVIVLSGEKLERLPAIRRFAFLLACLLVSILILLSLTPLSSLWFRVVSSVPPDLIPYAKTALTILILQPAFTVVGCVCQAILIKLRRTVFVTVGTALNGLVVIGALYFTTLCAGLPGYVAAPSSGFFAALCSMLYFLFVTRLVLKRKRADYQR